ncbi:MAG: FAD-binding oxidoreductase [Candidatus Dormibacteraeota bacterium]|nr:FAD-binding oxidoreductase [Candidatus Dormibacteraeota bacterium]
MRRSRPPITVDSAQADVRERWPAGRPLTGAQERLLAAACADVSTDAAALIDSATDWWPLALRWARRGEVPARPGAVVRPVSIDEVCAVLRVCAEQRIAVTAAGGRSGVCGGAVPLRGGIALEMGGLDGITGVDDVSLLVDALAGTRGADLEATLRHEHRLTLGHWPQSIDLSSVGGWLGCRAAGQYSTRYGKIEDIVAGLEVVLADGAVVRTGSIAGAGPRSATGPDLTQLFVGSEGTLGVVTRARLRAHPLPPVERRAAWEFDTFGNGIDAIRRALRRGATPAAVRLYDAEEARRNFNHDGVLFIALDEGDEAVVDAAMRVLAEECAGAAALSSDPVDHWFQTRKDVSALGRVVEMGVVVDTIEISASWAQLPGLYAHAVLGLRALEGTVAASAHLSHAYLDGACLYFTFAGLGSDPADDVWAEAYYHGAWDVVMRATLDHHGSISHHHGVGLVRSPYVSRALGEGFDVLRRVKAALDPNAILNPGKLGFE